MRFDDKSSARDYVWQRLETEGLAAYPFPPRGRIPNFRDAKLAAAKLFEAPLLATAQCIKVNPDSPQRHVRAEALRRGIRVYVPTPRLAGGFMVLDPASIPAELAWQAAALRHAGRIEGPAAVRRHRDRLRGGDTGWQACRQRRRLQRSGVCDPARIGSRAGGGRNDGTRCAGGGGFPDCAARPAFVVDRNADPVDRYRKPTACADGYRLAAFAKGRVRPDADLARVCLLGRRPLGWRLQP